MTGILKLMNSLLGRLAYLPVSFLVSIAMVLGLILFSSAEIANTLSVDEFRMKYRAYLGPAFLVTVFLLFSRLCSIGARKYRGWRNLKRTQKLLHQLTPEEKGYLIPYIQDKMNTVYARLDDGIMSGLQMKRIVTLACSVGYYNDVNPFNLQPWARNYLERNPHLLDGYLGEPAPSVEEIEKNAWMAR